MLRPALDGQPPSLRCTCSTVKESPASAPFVYDVHWHLHSICKGVNQVALRLVGPVYIGPGSCPAMAAPIRGLTSDPRQATASLLLHTKMQ